MIFGLDERIYADLARVFARYPAVVQVLIFGSRARDAWKPGSDIDLAVVAPGMSDLEFARLWNELDELPLVFKLDVVHLDRLNQAGLKARILAEGRVFCAPGVNLAKAAV
jgi:predicted nucleotidyltransferase